MKYPFLLLLILGGCAVTIPESSRPRIAPQSPDTGIIYLIRDRPRIEASVYANGTKLATLSDRRALRSDPMYTWLSIAPGRYRVGIYPLAYDWHGEAAAESALDIEGGKSYYIKVEWPPKPDPSFAESITQPLVEPIVGRKPYLAPGLILLPENQAMEIMSRCRFVESQD
jgi:hypothetical protein